jgi:hypothetical protein
MILDGSQEIPYEINASCIGEQNSLLAEALNLRERSSCI